MVALSIRFDASKHHFGESSEDIDCQCHPQLSVETSRFNLISELGLRRSEATNFDKRRVNQDVSITAHKFFDLSSACQTSYIPRDLLAMRVVQRLLHTGTLDMPTVTRGPRHQAAILLAAKGQGLLPSFSVVRNGGKAN